MSGRVLALVGLVWVGLGSAGCSSGPAECEAAGGRCMVGAGMGCAGTIGPQDCNPDRNPGGAVCCLPCPSGPSAPDGGGCG